MSIVGKITDNLFTIILLVGGLLLFVFVLLPLLINIDWGAVWDWGNSGAAGGGLAWWLFGSPTKEETIQAAIGNASLLNVSSPAVQRAAVGYSIGKASEMGKDTSWSLLDTVRRIFSRRGY